MTNTSRVAVIMLVLGAAQSLGLVWFGGRHLLDALERWFGLTGDHASLLSALAGLLLALGYAGLSMSGLPEIRSNLFKLNALKILSIAFAGVTGTFEEIFFRRWVMNWAFSQGFSPFYQIIISAILFAAAHAIWGLFGGSLQALFKSLVFTAGLGLGLGLLYIFAGRVIAPCIWSHILINLILEPWLLLSVLNLRSHRADPVGR